LHPNLLKLTHYNFTSQELGDVDTGSDDFFQVYDMTDQINIGLYDDYSKLQDDINGCKLCDIRDMTMDPATLVIPIDQIRKIKVDFSSVLKRLF
jgi:hypothetical protein